MKLKQEQKIDLNRLKNRLELLLDTKELKSEQGKLILQSLWEFPADFPLEDLSPNIRTYAAEIHAYLTHERRDIQETSSEILREHLGLENTLGTLNFNITLPNFKKELLFDQMKIDSESLITRFKDLMTPNPLKYDLVHDLTNRSPLSDILSTIPLDKLDKLVKLSRARDFIFKYPFYYPKPTPRYRFEELSSSDDIELYKKKVDVILESLKNTIEALAKTIDGDKTVTAHALDESLKPCFELFEWAIRDVCYTGFYAKSLQQEWFRLEKNLYEAVSKWHIYNQDPMGGIDSLLNVPENNPHFISMRFQAFSIAFSNYQPHLSANQAYFESFPLCVGSDKKLLAFDNIDQTDIETPGLRSDKTFQDVANSFLLAAANIYDENLNKLTSEDQSLLLQWAYLIFKGVPVQKPIVSSATFTTYIPLEISSLTALRDHQDTIKNKFLEIRHSSSWDEIGQVILRFDNELPRPAFKFE